MFRDLKNKKILIMGLGIAGGGLSVTKWLYQQGAKITITDLRDKKTLALTLKKMKNLDIKYILGRHRAKDFKNTDLIIKNPAVPINSPYLKIAKKSGVPVTSDIELFSQRWPGKIIALTGTKGKSTTIHLIYHILKQTKKPCCLGGNVGETPLSFLTNARPNQTAILELSSFQLENLKIKPDISLITNVFPDHLNRHHTMVQYTTAKSNIFKNQSSNQYAIFNYDNKILRQLAHQVKAKLIFFSTKITTRPANCQMLFCTKNNQLMIVNGHSSRALGSLDKIKLLGPHNVENILAAAATAYLLQIRPAIITRAINGFTGIPHRLELVRAINGVKYYNDTTATNPGAAIAALKALTQREITAGGLAHQNYATMRANKSKDKYCQTNKANKKRIILVAGGADKNLNFNELSWEIKNTCKQVVMLAGTATPKFIQALKKINYPLKNITEFDNFKKAIYFAKTIAQPSDIILLSPGCASFGMFANEFDRGKQFVKIVKKI